MRYCGSSAKPTGLKLYFYSPLSLRSPSLLFSSLSLPSPSRFAETEIKHKSNSWMFNDKAEVPLRVHPVFAQLPVCVCVCVAAIVPCATPHAKPPLGPWVFAYFCTLSAKNKNPKTTVKGKRINYAFQQSLEGGGGKGREQEYKK